MDAAHLRHHLRELRDRERFLRTLRPDSERYKLWLGDIVEFVNVAYGADSPQMAELRAALVGQARPAPDAPREQRERLYHERLDRIAAVLDGYARTVRDPLRFFDLDGRSDDAPPA
jgi:hypothetical protein